MRKFNKKTKITFWIFVAIVLIMLSIFLYFITEFAANEKFEKQLDSSYTLFDIEYNLVDLSNEGVLFKHWDGKYYYRETGSKNVIPIGKNVVLFSKNSSTMHILGNNYSVEAGGKVVSNKGITEIDMTKGDYFYKLDDREYLTVSKNINDGDELFGALHYLIVIVDKQGNALLLNNNVNIKTLKPIVLKTRSYEFDIAKELLISGDEEVDLKRVIGSTNAYVEKIPEKKKQETNNSVGGGFLPRNPGLSDSDGNNQANLDLQKWVNIRKINSGPTHIEVEYTVFDPNNNYSSVFVIVNDGIEPSKKYELSKIDSKYNIRNLKNNHQYILKFGYSIYDQDLEEVVDVFQEEFTIRTKQPNFSLEFTKIRTDRIDFRLKLDPKLIVDKGNLVLYVDSLQVETIDINFDAAHSKNGWEGHLYLYNPGYEVLLSLEDVYSGGEMIDVDLFVKYINY